MKRRLPKTASICVAIAILGVIGIVYAINAWTPNSSKQTEQPTLEMQWQAYPDLKSLTEEAEYIVAARLENMIGTRDHPNVPGIPITDFSATVTTNIKGKLTQGDSIRISQFGGPSPYAVSETDPIMKAGEDYVFFLVYEQALDSYGYLGGPQGKFLIQESKAYSMDNVEPEASFVHVKVKDKPIDDFEKEISDIAGSAN